MTRPKIDDIRIMVGARVRSSIMAIVDDTKPKGMTKSRRLESLILQGLAEEGHGDRIRALGITPCVRETVQVRMGTKEQLAKMPPAAKPEAHCDYLDGQGEKGDQTAPTTASANPQDDPGDSHG